mgnify:CR=1 FL=1
MIVCVGADFVDLLGIVGKVLAQFVAQVGVGVLVAHHFHGVVGTHGTVVGGQDSGLMALPV